MKVIPQVSYVCVATLTAWFSIASVYADVRGSRPVLKDVSAVVVSSGSSSARSIRIEDVGQIGAVVNELNVLRRREWQPWVGKLGACSRRAIFFNKESRLMALYIDAKGVIELPLVKGESRFALELTAKEAPRLREFVAQIALPEGCRE